MKVNRRMKRQGKYMVEMKGQKRQMELRSRREKEETMDEGPVIRTRSTPWMEATLNQAGDCRLESTPGEFRERDKTRRLELNHAPWCPRFWS